MVRQGFKSRIQRNEEAQHQRRDGESSSLHPPLSAAAALSGCRLCTLGVEMQNFPKSYYRHHTGTTEVGINTGMLPALHMLYYCVDLINTGNLPATCRYYRHAGNVVMKFCFSSWEVSGCILAETEVARRLNTYVLGQREVDRSILGRGE